jgi:hypothetical protein
MVLSLTVWYLNVLFQITNKDDNLILADESFLRMYSKDGKSVKEYKLGGTAWDISYHKMSGRIVVALQGEGIQFVDNFVAHTKISVQNINSCLCHLSLCRL